MKEREDIDWEAVMAAKGDGQPYADRFKEDYEKMTPEERKVADGIIAMLSDLMGAYDDETD